jgi:hypothetical protein
MNFKGSLDINLNDKKKKKKKKNLSYRPNHMNGRGRNGRTAQVASERGPLSAGGPRLVLPHLHIVILKQQGYYLQRIIKERPKRKGDYINRNPLKESSIT